MIETKNIIILDDKNASNKINDKIKEEIDNLSAKDLNNLRSKLSSFECLKKIINKFQDDKSKIKEIFTKENVFFNSKIFTETKSQTFL